MKSILTACLLLSFSRLLISQNTAKTVLDSTYYYMGAPETAGTNIYRKVYSYDSKGNTTGYIESMLTVGESAWKTSGGWIYAINSAGKITESASYSYFPGSQHPVWQFRYVSDYDIFGNVVQYAEDKWNAERNNWVGIIRNTYVWDDHKNQIELNEFKWDLKTNSWLETSHSVSSYDAGGNLTEKIAYYEWDSRQRKWKFGSREVNVYDPQENKISFTYFIWDALGSNWQNSTYWTYDNKYNDFGKTIDAVQYFWNRETDEWKLSSKNIYVYDPSGNQTEETYFQWDSSLKEWKGSYRSVFDYDLQGNVIKEVYYYWDPGINDWLAQSKVDNEFDSGNHQTGHYYYQWEAAAKGWIGYEGYSNAFDNNGNQTEHITYSWNQGANRWINVFRTVNTYNSDGTISETNNYGWDAQVNDWAQGTSKMVYYWSTLKTEKADHNLVYPNPFTDYATIKLADAVKVTKIEFIDTSGRIVRTLSDIEGYNTIIIQRGNLPKGIYLLRIFSSSISTEKIICW